VEALIVDDQVERHVATEPVAKEEHGRQVKRISCPERMARQKRVNGRHHRCRQLDHVDSLEIRVKRGHCLTMLVAGQRTLAEPPS
jgi:hypothetical protein